MSIYKANLTMNDLRNMTDQSHSFLMQKHIKNHVLLYEKYNSILFK